jgi:hypothetical protein
VATYLLLPVAWIYAVELCGFTPGTTGPNRFGAGPLASANEPCISVRFDFALMSMKIWRSKLRRVREGWSITPGAHRRNLTARPTATDQPSDLVAKDAVCHIKSMGRPSHRGDSALAQMVKGTLDRAGMFKWRLL